MRRIAFLLALLFFASLPAEAQELEITHMHVGQGDATLILGPPDEAGDRVSVLVDAGDITIGGGRDGGRIVLNRLAERGVDRIDFFVATHYDADHIGGAITGALGTHGRSFALGPDGVPGGTGDDDGDGDEDWLDDRTRVPDPEELGSGDDIVVAKFLDCGDHGTPSTQTYMKYKALAEAHGNRRSFVDLDDVEGFEVDLGGGAGMRLLAANGFVRGHASQVDHVNTENERSLAFLVQYKGFDYVIGGDLTGRDFGSENAAVERAVGQFLVDEGVEVDVLHANHHGANNGSNFEFLELIRPEVAVISLGNGNAHHHPHVETLQRLAAAGVSRIYQTAWGTTEGAISEAVRHRQAIFQGDVVIRTDGDSIRITTEQIFETDEPIH